MGVVSRRRRRWAEGHLLLINLRKKIQKLTFLNQKAKKRNEEQETSDVVTFFPD